MSLTLDMTWPPNLDEGFGMLTGIGFNPKIYRSSEFNPSRHSQVLLDITKVIFELLQPEFGWIEICREKGYTTLEDLNRISIPHIYLIG